MSTGLYCPWFYIQLRDNNGDPLSNGYMETYENKSTIPKPVYSDVNLLYPLTNPVELDSAGIVPRFFMTSGAYTITFKDRFGSVLASADDIIGLGGESSVSAYILPTASPSVLGGIKVGSGLSIDGSGILSVLPTSAQTISLSGYATLSGANFSGSVTSPTFSANSISATKFETSSVKFTTQDSFYKSPFETNGNSNSVVIEGKGDEYSGNVGIVFGKSSSNNLIGTVDGILHIGGLNNYTSFDGSNFYITSGNLVVGDPSVATNLGTKSLINNQQLQQNYRAIFNSSAFILDKFKNKTLSTDSTGQLSGYDVGGVAYNSGDIPKTISAKLKAGTGCVLTTATDSTNGIVTSINFKGNSWRYLKNISTAAYTILDTDDVLINLNTNSIFTLPTASSLYEGRVVQIRGGLLGSTVTVNSLSTIVGSPSVVITNYDKRDFLCYYNSVQWQWVITN